MSGPLRTANPKKPTTRPMNRLVQCPTCRFPRWRPDHKAECVGCDLARFMAGRVRRAEERSAPPPLDTAVQNGEAGLDEALTDSPRATVL